MNILRVAAIALVTLSVGLQNSGMAQSTSQYIFRYKDSIARDSSPQVPGVSYGIGNDITAFFAGPIGYEFSKTIPVATKDVAEWRRVKGEYHKGLKLDPATGTIHGVPTGRSDEREAVLIGYDVNGKDIARASINFKFHDPVGRPQQALFYGHTHRYMHREIVSTVSVARWEPLVPLPGNFKIEGRFLSGTPSRPYDESLSFIGYDYMGREVAFATGKLLVQDGPTFDWIADQHKHPRNEFQVFTRVQHSFGLLKYRLISLDGNPSSLTFNGAGELRGYIKTFNTSLRFQIEAVDVDGTRGTSNVFTLSTFAPDVDISDMRDLHAVVNVPYSLQMNATDLSGDQNWQVIGGRLPDGLELSPSGVISGTPLKEEIQEHIVVSVTTSDNGYAESKPFRFAVAPEGVTIGFTALKTRINTPFVTAGPAFEKGVLQPHAFAPADGFDVHPSMRVDYKSGIVDGVLDVAGDYSVPFAFTNGDGRQFGFIQPIGIFNPLSVEYANPITFRRLVDSSEHPTIAANSVIGESHFTLVAGEMPEGLELDSRTGVIVGTPVTIGKAKGLIVEVQDSSGERAQSNTFDLDVLDRPDVEVIAFETTVERFVANDIQFVTGRNTFGETSFILESGTLPGGLRLEPDGRITGTTSADEGTYGGLTVRAVDGEGYAGLSAQLTLSVVRPKNLESLDESSIRADWTRSAEFSIPLPRPRNAFGTMVFDLKDLPGSVSVAGDRLNGRIDRVGSYVLPMTATDEVGRSVAGTFTLNILEPMSANLVGTGMQDSSGFLGRGSAISFHLPRGAAADIRPDIVNGIAPITFSFSGKLPTGMEYVEDAVTGIPTVETESTSFELTATDAAGTSVRMAARLQVVERLPVSVSYDFSAPLRLNTTDTLPRVPNVENALGPVTFSLSGNLPQGITLDPKTGNFRGRPTEDGRFPNIVIVATDGEGSDYSGSTEPFEIGVSRGGPIGLGSETYFTVRTGEEFQRQLKPTNVTSPLVFRTADGNPVPHGLSLITASGTIYGRFDSDGKYDARIMVTDDFGRSAATLARFTSVAPLSISSPTVVTFNQYAAVNLRPKVANAIGKTQYELAAGNLPTGFQLDAASGRLFGSAEAKGSWPGIILRVTDASGKSAATSPFTMTVTDRLPLRMGTSASYAVFANMPYKMTLPIGDAVGKVSFQQTGTLPTGIAFDPATGTFTGRATVIGTFPGIKVTATDSVGGTISKTFSFVVSTNSNPIALNVTAFTTKIGYPISTAAPSYSNHVGDVRFWADDSLRENGLTIDPTTGVISGIATKLSDLSPNVHITDGSDRVTSKPISIKVVPNTVINVPSRIDAVVNVSVPSGVNKVTFDNIIGTTKISMEGRLPKGLSFNSSSIYGTPTEMGTFDIVIRAVDSLGDAGAADVRIVVANNGQPPTIDFVASPTGYVAQNSFNLSLKHGNKKVGDLVTLAPDSAPLPPGMSLVQTTDGSYVLSKTYGTLEDVGVYRGIKLRVIDMDGLYSDSELKTIVLIPRETLRYENVYFSERGNLPVSVSAPKPSAGVAVADVKFEFSNKGTGGQDLVIDTRSGAISGVITASGTNIVTYTESYDGVVLRSANYNVTFTKVDLSLSTEPSLYLVAGQQTGTRPVTAVGTREDGRFEIVGDIPAGLSPSADGRSLTGTPSVEGIYEVVYAYEDSYQRIETRSKLKVASPQAPGHRYWRLAMTSSGGGLWSTAARVSEVDWFTDDSFSIKHLASVISPHGKELIDYDLNTATGVYSDSHVNPFTFDFGRMVDVKSVDFNVKSGQFTVAVSWSDDNVNWNSVPSTLTGNRLLIGQ